jgi:hypothetical protein
MSFDRPTRRGFDAGMHDLTTDKFDEMKRAHIQVQSDFIKAGGLEHSRYPVTTADRYDTILRTYLNEAAERAAAFIDRLSAPGELASWLRPHAESLRDRALAEIPNSPSLHGVTQSLRSHYHTQFTARINQVLRDLEIGIVKGKSIPVQKPADLLQLKPTLWGMGLDLKEVMRRIGARWPWQRPAQ